MEFKTIRDYVLTFVAINLFLHYNFPGYIEWANGNREKLFSFAYSTVGSSLSFIFENIVVIAFGGMLLLTVISLVIIYLDEGIEGIVKIFK